VTEKEEFVMRKILLSVVGIVLLIGCYEQPFETDTEPPAVPRGVYSITGDREVVISWYPNAESDLAGYHVYRGLSERGNYFRIATTRATTVIDRDVVNGRTYYYAISAYDANGNESDLSYDLVFDTPRPEGYGVRLFDFSQNPQFAGYDFSAYHVQDFRSISTDIFFEYHAPSGGLFINVANVDTDIQDVGYTESLDEVDYAPEQGWSPLGYVECLVGHSYVVWTADNHFAKIRITAANPSFVEFDWAYQLVEGNRELLVHNSSPEKVARLRSLESKHAN
jgi:hypothetical protein